LRRAPLSGKAVLITGASGGIGEALALECARRGARLALASRDQKKLSLVAKACLAAGAPEAKTYKLDVSKAAACKAVARKAQSDFGGIDVLVNNAGVHLFAKVAELPEAMFESAMQTNLYGPLRLIQALLPGMRKRGGGLIVNVGSTLGYRAIPNAGGYCATKGALARLTESLRVELKGTGVRVLEASPGVVTTALRANALWKGVKPAPVSDLPFPRSAQSTARDIADAMESGRRDITTAAFPAKLLMKYVNLFVPKLVDRVLSR
jgi:short-subunit dehydrogenase